MVERNNTLAPDNFLKTLIRNGPIFAQKLGQNDQFFDIFCPIFQYLAESPNYLRVYLIPSTPGFYH